MDYAGHIESVSMCEETSRCVKTLSMCEETSRYAHPYRLVSVHIDSFCGCARAGVHIDWFLYTSTTSVVVHGRGVQTRAWGADTGVGCRRGRGGACGG